MTEEFKGKTRLGTARVTPFVKEIEFGLNHKKIKILKNCKQLSPLRDDS